MKRLNEQQSSLKSFLKDLSLMTQRLPLNNAPAKSHHPTS
jgi:hypothetical protein